MSTPAYAAVGTLPLSASIWSRLARRGVEVKQGDDEDGDRHAARIETALMALFRDERDEGSFQALYEASSPRLLTWIASLLGGRRREIDPLEVLQDAYVNIYRYAQSFRDEEVKSFRVWSRTIVGNLIRRSRMTSAVRSIDALPEGSAEPLDRRASPAESLAQAEATRLVARGWMIVLLQYAAAFAELGPRDRLALELVEVDGLSYAEAGRRLKVGMSNMKMIMFRSRRRIRDQIARRFESRGRRLAG